MGNRLKSLMVTASVCALATTVYAASVHLVPTRSNPSFTDNGLTLTATGTLSGLGNANANINLSAQANVKATCTNPSGGNQPPGNNPPAISVSGVEPVQAGEIKNGNFTFSVTTNAPPNPIPGARGCPNPNWTETITDLLFTSASVTVEQPAGTGDIVFTVSCTLNPPNGTDNGPVPKQEVTCTSS
jgi:hypothetical protein